MTTIKNGRPDLKIAGSMNAAGGIYNQVIVNGHAEIYDSVECAEFRINGFASVDGNVKTNIVRINGKSTIKGNLDANEVKVCGSVKILEDASFGNAKIQGSAIVDGDVSAEEISADGELKITKNCNSEKFISNGEISIDGLLNAGIIEMKIYCRCQAKEIGGEKITVKKAGNSAIAKFIKSIFLLPDAHREQLITDIIEGDDIYLESTKAQVVRGTNIKIGPECEIELIEYKGRLETSDDAKIITCKRI